MQDLSFIVELASWRILHFNVTAHPTDAWVAPQLRETMPYGEAPRFLLRDNDRKFGSAFASVARTSGTEILRIPYRAPRANAICERFLGSVRRECLDHFLILSEGQLYRMIKEYVSFLNAGQPHQGIEQRIPDELGSSMEGPREGKIIAFPILNGLHHDYPRAA